MKLTFLGATETVTGSKYLLEAGKHRILVDCGLFQGYKDLRERNWKKLPFDIQSLDAVILTHAHLDHSGYLPLLVRNGFRRKIYATHATYDLCSLLLPDSGYLQEEDARRANRYRYTKHSPAQPLYTLLDAERSLDFFHTIPFGQEVDLGDGLRFSLHRAGHILGAAMVAVSHHGKRIVFTGDMGRPNDDILHPPAPIGEADYLVVESTYGNRKHPETDALSELEAIVNRTNRRGGTVLIPAFAVGRAQHLLYYLHKLKEQKRIPAHLPVFLDSPMAINATEIFSRHTSEHKLSHEHARAICDSATYVHTPEESKELASSGMPCVIISASGMATGGRVLHHLRRLAPNHRNTILFVGFQAGGTRGDRILRGEKEVKMLGDTVHIDAEVVELENMSAHADYAEMLGYLKTAEGSPTVFITHGEREAAESFQSHIEDTFRWKCHIPTYGQKFDL